MSWLSSRDIHIAGTIYDGRQYHIWDGVRDGDCRDNASGDTVGMKIYSYIMAFPDDQDVLANALDSLAPFSDRIYLIDGGMTQGSLCHHPRFTEAIRYWMDRASMFRGYSDGLSGASGYKYLWGARYITLWENPFLDPGNQRNWIIKKMESESEQPDWVCWIDADEVCSDQFISEARNFLEAQPPEVTNVVPQWLNLIVDEQHMAGGNHSSWLAHGRLYRPGTVYWNAGWHEHQYYQGKRVQFDTRIIHTRGLYRRRLLVQRGHPRVSGKDNPLWGDVVTPEPIPSGVTWRPLHWPEGEIALDFNTDALTVWDERGGLRSTRAD